MIVGAKVGEVYRIVVETPTAHISRIHHVTVSSIMVPERKLEKMDELSGEISGKKPHRRASLLHVSSGRFGSYQLNRSG